MAHKNAKVISIDGLSVCKSKTSHFVRKSKMSKMTPNDFKEMNEASKKSRGISSVTITSL
jgi:hypothetical protein